MKKLWYSFFILASVLFLTNCDSAGGYLGESDLAYSDGLGKSSSSGSDDGGNQTEPQAGLITAGEWNDLDHWTFLDSLLTADTVGFQNHWSFFVRNRIAVKITDASSTPAINLKVELKRNGTTVWTAKTDNFGKAELWTDLFQAGTSQDVSNLSITVDGLTISNVKDYASGVNEIKLNSTKTIPNKAELAFVVDATGSMGDELEFLKTELLDVINTAKNDNPGVSMYTGSVFYRDEGDDYVTKTSDFTTNTQTTLNFIKNQSSSGGGDFPEAVHTALDKAINNLQWSVDARTRIIFLVLDAPPHYETGIITDLQKHIKSAAAQGIKIIPVTASGIDKETEFLMRFFSISTNGTYVFITNDSGIGNEHLQPTIGKYEVEHLNSLMVRLINKYIKVNQPG